MTPKLKVLISEKEIQDKIKEMAELISRDYLGKKILLVGILKGAVVFLADLCRQLDVPAQIDFMAVSSYGSSTASSGVVRILKDLDEEIEGRDVLLVEDIVDTGLTLKYLKENLEARNPSSLRIVSLLDKPDRRKVKIEPDYWGFQIPNEFVVGYGLDYDEDYRHLPQVCILLEFDR